jgi:hypothetical protein
VALSHRNAPAYANILAIEISLTGGLPGMACGSSQTTGRKQENLVREGRSSALRVAAFDRSPVRS